MKRRTQGRIGFLGCVASCLILAACGGSSTSALDPYTAQVNQFTSLQTGLSGLVQTAPANMPQSGSALYEGVALADVSQLTGGGLTVIDTVAADVSLAANFDTDRIAGVMSGFNSKETGAMGGSLNIAAADIVGAGYTTTAQGTLVRDGVSLNTALDVDGGFGGTSAQVTVGDLTGQAAAGSNVLYIAGAYIAKK